MKGLVHIYTGDGKGKTTSALGLALRASGQGFKVIIIQFLKGAPNCGEHRFASKYQPFEIVQLTRGNCFTLPEEQLQQDVERTMELVEDAITGGKYRMVILDEVFAAINRGMLDTAQIVDLIKRKPEEMELVLTGRSAPAEIIELADYVTEMQMVKHPYSQGIKGRRGIEF
ncbi:MAG: cob(I)yrinic acid a,c-diamide adenosyltransferase [Dehalococcoidia bacterium]